MIKYLKPFGPIERFGTLSEDVFYNDYDSRTGQEQPCLCMRPGCVLCRGLRPETCGYPYSEGQDIFPLTGFGHSARIAEE